MLVSKKFHRSFKKKKYFPFESQYISICKIIWDWTTFFTSKLFMNDNMFAVLEIIFQSLPFNELFAYLKLKRILTQRLKQRRVLTKLWNEIHNKSTNKQSPHIPCSRAFFFLQKNIFAGRERLSLKGQNKIKILKAYVDSMTMNILFWNII